MNTGSHSQPATTTNRLVVGGLGDLYFGDQKRYFFGNFDKHGYAGMPKNMTKYIGPKNMTPPKKIYIMVLDGYW